MRRTDRCYNPIPMALCPNCFNHLPEAKTICLSCGAVIDGGPKSDVHDPMSDEADRDRRHEVAGELAAEVVPSSLGNSLRENKSAPERELSPDKEN